MPVELGMAFTADANGSIAGIRFYKDPLNTGTHTVSLWTASGISLATATVTNESTAGWQEADFASPVSISKNTVYIASYHNPSHYAYTSAGLSTAIDRSPLHTPATPGGTPTHRELQLPLPRPTISSTRSSLPAPDAPPQVASIDPADNATSVPVGAWITANFSGPVQTQTVSIVVTDPNGNVVPGSSADESGAAAAIFVPTSNLAASTRYTVTISGVVSSGGTPMNGTFVSHFTTSGVASCPCTVFSSSALPQQSDSGDGAALSVGLAFPPSVDGFVTGVRFYADASNTGTHTGSLFGPDGSRLATVTFPTVVTPGWQYATFTTPVSVSAGANYVVSTYMPNGHYSDSTNFFTTPYVNTPLTGTTGLYTYGSDTQPTSTYQASNYYVDAIFTPGAAASGTLSVTTRTPADTATGVSVSSAVTGTFNGAIDQGTLQFTVTGPGGTPVAGSVSYDTSSNIATFQPSAALNYGALYSVSLSAVGSSGAAMASRRLELHHGQRTGANGYGPISGQRSDCSAHYFDRERCI